ncbi:putative nuclease HARBI1 [Lineus longissimus]|uniref:putative nuclease HARBI1 n=1 Tax=Lineus longissimus TaxID=88925 RepID=UPI00315D25B7
MLLYPNLARKARTFRHKDSDLDIFDDNNLRQRYRFSRASIEYITDLIRDQLERPTKRSHSLSPEQQVMLALRFYATGSFVQVISDLQGFDKGTGSRVIVKVTNALAGLKDRFIKWPNDEEREVIHAGFYEMCQFPNVLGCLDGTHVKIQGPSTPQWYRELENAGPRPTYESTFVCRKQYHSINTQGICDHKGKLINVVARWPGATHDSHIFKESQIGQHLSENNQGMREGYLLGDSGYPCKPFLLTPYLRPTTQAEKRYNTAQKKTRNSIERCFGTLKRRFHCLHGEIRMRPERTCKIIIACCVLNNIAIDRREPLLGRPRREPHERHVYQGPHDGLAVRRFVTERFFQQ